jgi:hypothetical protein
VKIYDHPLNSSVTVIEIEACDENKEFLNNVIDGFGKFGSAYPSASCGDGDKKVIYLDGRYKNFFNKDETDILCDLTIQLAKINVSSPEEITAQSISMAQAAGEKELLGRLINMPPEYFDILKPVKNML